jgi:glycosyltransferase involved in cell wall biosynthesis
LIEALSFGRPVLAAAVGGIPEIITEGVEGCFWDLDNPEGGADILISLLEDPIRWQSMSDRARLTFQARFHPDVLADRWLDTIMFHAADQQYPMQTQSTKLEKNY